MTRFQTQRVLVFEPRRRGSGTRFRPGEHGYSLVALMAGIAVMLILMTAAVPTWRYVMKNDREEELIFRGGEIADAIARYQRKNGNALPVSLDILVKGKFLRRAYKDPMTKDGVWRFVRPGELLGPAPANPQAGGSGSVFTTTTTTTTTTRPSAFGFSAGAALGPFQGVASKSTEKSLRLFNGRSKYSEWVFVPGQPRVIGKPIGIPGMPGVPGQGGRPQMPMPMPGPIGPRPGGAPPGNPVNPLQQPYVVPP